MKAPHARLFQDVAWSTEVVAAETRARARSLGLEVVELPLWYDVDDASSLRLLVRELACTSFQQAQRAHLSPHRPRYVASPGSAWMLVSESEDAVTFQADQQLTG